MRLRLLNETRANVKAVAERDLVTSSVVRILSKKFVFKPRDEPSQHKSIFTYFQEGPTHLTTYVCNYDIQVFNFLSVIKRYTRSQTSPAESSVYTLFWWRRDGSTWLYSPHLRLGTYNRLHRAPPVWGALVGKWTLSFFIQLCSERNVKKRLREREGYEEEQEEHQCDQIEQFIGLWATF